MEDTNEHEKTLEDIRTVGWSVILIPEDEEGPAFGYTLGLFQSYGHPEVLIQGLLLERIFGILNGIGDLVKEGLHFNAGEEVEGVLEGYSCAFRAIDPGLYGDYLGYGMRFYQDAPFPALQAIWPDMRGRFPWQEGFPAALSERQLLRHPQR